MNDQEFADLSAGVQVHVDRWVHRFGLDTWKLHVSYERDGDEFSPSRRDGPVRSFVSAHTVTNWKYMEATLTFNCKALSDQSHEEVEAVVVHELTHILIAELREEVDDWLAHEERTVTMLTRAFLTTRNEALEVNAEKEAG